MKLERLVVSVVLLTAAPSAWSVEIVECEDDQGNRTFESACPPGTMQVSLKHYSTQPAAAEPEAKPALSAVLYVISDCEVCNQVREYLTVRNVSITEKNVQDNVGLQNELKERAGQLRVPVTIIGDSVVIGYERDQLAGALSAAGLTEEAASEAAAEENTEETEEGGETGETPE